MLKLSADRTDGATRLRVAAVKGRSYTVLARGLVDQGDWQVVQHFEAACDCEVDVADASGAAATRYYRVVTPRTP